MSKQHKHNNKQTKQWARQRVISYWLAVAQWYESHSSSDNADMAINNAIWCETAPNDKLQAACKQWYAEDHAYWQTVLEYEIEDAQRWQYKEAQRNNDYHWEYDNNIYPRE